jgi:hypothetical protein
MNEANSGALFSLSLSGDGINIEREIDREVALQVINVVLGVGGQRGSVAINPESPAAQLHAAVPLSLREYLDDVKAVRKPDQIVTIGHFICEHEHAGDFGRDDIRSRFASAREPLPANFSRDFAWTVKNGWVAEVHGKKDRYYVTSKGIQAVESHFSQETKKATPKPRNGTRRRQVNDQIRED